MRKRKGRPHRKLLNGSICNAKNYHMSKATFSFVRTLWHNTTENVHGDVTNDGTGLGLWKCRQTGDLVQGPFKRSSLA